MKIVPTTVLYLTVAMPLLGAPSSQQRPSAADQADPRVGLAPGFRDAGVAAQATWSWSSTCRSRRASTTPRLQPAAPGGREDSARNTGRWPSLKTQAPAEPRANRSAGSPAPPRPGSGLSFTNSDLAFSGEHLFMGNYHGFNIYSVEDAEPRRAPLFRGVSWRPGRSVGPTATFSSCRCRIRGHGSTAAPRASRSRSAPSASAVFASSTSAI